MKPSALLGLAASLLAGAPALAHDESNGAGRSIAIETSDRLRFTPAEVSVRKGEIVRFVVRNSGKLMHEFVLGTMEELKAHAQMMQKHPAMEHDAPHMAHVAPGRARSVTWRFTEGGEFYYGCLVPGHFEAGMVGRVVVR